MRISKTTKRFRKDYAKLKKSGSKDMKKLHVIMGKLIDGEKLSEKYKDHALHGNWCDFRDCHIESDWVLIYRLSKDEKDNEEITFCATDKHPNLFD